MKRCKSVASVSCPRSVLAPSWGSSRWTNPCCSDCNLQCKEFSVLHYFIYSSLFARTEHQCIPLGCAAVGATFEIFHQQQFVCQLNKYQAWISPAWVARLEDLLTSFFRRQWREINCCMWKMHEHARMV